MSIDLGAMTSLRGGRESRLPLMSPCSRARLGIRTPRRPAFRADRRHVVALESGRDHRGETAPKSVAAMVPTAYSVVPIYTAEITPSAGSVGASQTDFLHEDASKPRKSPGPVQRWVPW
jgi:hypothetical protein